MNSKGKTMSDTTNKEHANVIAVSYEMAPFDTSDIPAKIAAINDATFVKEVVPEIKDVLERIKTYEDHEKAFKAKCDEAISKGREYKKTLLNVKELAENKALDEFHRFKLITRKVNDDGDTVEEYDSQLPSGFSVRKGKRTYQYDEERLLADHPEFFILKPVLNKELVDEMIAAGKLSVSYRPYKDEDMSVVLTAKHMKHDEKKPD